MIDIGANLTNKAFRGDLDRVIDRAQQAGVDRILVTGTSLGASRAAAELVATRPGELFATTGVHPHDARTCDANTLDELRLLAGETRVVAIGECGLDFNRNYSPPETQLEWFEKQVVLAGELGLPLFLHERDAHEALVTILRRNAFPRAVVHCFTGSRAELHAYLDMGLYIGITGWICDERRGGTLCELAREIPLDRLMIETDAPYLLPRSLRPRPKGGRNEPAYLVHVRDRLAECIGIAPQELAEATTHTAEGFFGLDQLSSPANERNP